VRPDPSAPRCPRGCPLPASDCAGPIGPAAWGRFAARCAVDGAQSALEATLLELNAEAAGRWMMLLREGRAGFLPMLTPGGTALLIGNAGSGAALALCRAGYRLWLADRCRLRASAALATLRALLGPAAPVAALCFDGERLPMRDHSVDLIVRESPAPPLGLEGGPSLAELARVARRELLIAAENRLAYKRSSGQRADFRLLSPRELLARLARPSAGEASLRGHLSRLRSAHFDPERSFALYPHSHDWSHLLALDGPRPRLTVGPMERKNRLKLLAQRAGAVPWLAPSFALLARAPGATPGEPAWRGLLARAAVAAGEPLPELDVLIATRGNTAVLQTCLPGGDPRDPRGRFTLHLALSPQQEVQARRHIARLREIRARFPDFPIPTPLYEEQGPLGHATAERRLPGHTAAQFTGQERVLGPLYARLAEQLATLRVAPAAPLDPAGFERLIAARVELVARRAAVASTRQALEGFGRLAQERLLGLPFPRVLYHADLRAKHVMTDPRGRCFGLLDWGSSEDADLPYFDLLNLILHDRKQAAGRSIAWAWGLVRESGPAGLFAHERRALEDYAARLELPALYCRTIEQIYPLLVSAMAEANWDYSRPRWVHQNFGL
jgi:aminoglycoside phosphotransferase (APT) family kinase protein